MSTCSFLDAKDATNLEYKLDSFSSVYHRLTGSSLRFPSGPAFEADLLCVLMNRQDRCVRVPARPGARMRAVGDEGLYA